MKAFSSIIKCTVNKSAMLNQWRYDFWKTTCHCFRYSTQRCKKSSPCQRSAIFRHSCLL